MKNRGYSGAFSPLYPLSFNLRVWLPAHVRAETFPLGGPRCPLHGRQVRSPEFRPIPVACA